MADCTESFSKRSLPRYCSARGPLRTLHPQSAAESYCKVTGVNTKSACPALSLDMPAIPTVSLEKPFSRERLPGSF